MGFRFRKSIKIAPGVRVNLSRRGVSTSIGPRGAKLNVGRQGVRATVGLPGTGISYSKTIGTRKRTTRRKNSAAITTVRRVGLIQRLFLRRF